MTITLDDMKPKLLTPDEALEKIEAVEGVSWLDFVMDGSDDVKAEFPSGWNGGILDRHETELTDAVMSIGGTEHPLTVKAAMDLTSAIGLRRPYVVKTPGALVTPHVNYWLENQNERRRVLLGKDGSVAAVCKPGKADPYNSGPLFEAVVKSMQEKFGSEEVWVDFKMETTLDNVTLRLIGPSTVEIKSLRNGTETDDEWSTGVQFQNSLTGAKALSLSGYLFAWWCQNGEITTHTDSARYRRRASGDLASASEWIAGAAPAVMESLDHEIESVQALVDMDLGDIGSAVHEIFVQYSVPLEQRATILENLASSEDSSAYGVMNAFTQAANTPDINDALREKLMTIGGDLTFQFSDRCESCHRLPIR